MAGHVVSIDQTITAGNDWNGAAPTTTPVDTRARRIFPTDTVGGLFEFDLPTDALLYRIERISVDFGGVATKQIVIRRVGGGVPDSPIFTSVAAGERYILIGGQYPMILAPDEVLVIESTGAVASMHARVTARIEARLPIL